jgi:hypothetical protein
MCYLVPLTALRISATLCKSNNRREFITSDKVSHIVDTEAIVDGVAIVAPPTGALIAEEAPYHITIGGKSFQ